MWAYVVYMYTQWVYCGHRLKRYLSELKRFSGHWTIADLYGRRCIRTVHAGGRRYALPDHGVIRTMIPATRPLTIDQVLYKPNSMQSITLAAASAAGTVSICLGFSCTDKKLITNSIKRCSRVLCVFVCVRVYEHMQTELNVAFKTSQIKLVTRGKRYRAQDECSQRLVLGRTLIGRRNIEEGPRWGRGEVCSRRQCAELYIGDVRPPWESWIYFIGFNRSTPNSKLRRV